MLIDKEIYIVQPTGFEDSKFLEKVYKLNKALYGLKQSLRLWYQHLRGLLLKTGFQTFPYDEAIFFYNKNNLIIIICCHVDDLAVSTNQEQEMKELFQTLKKEIKLKYIGLLSSFLGNDFEIDYIKKTLFINQKRYIFVCLFTHYL